MELFYRTEQLGTYQVHSFALVEGNKTTIIRTNTANRTQIEINHLAGKQVGQDYQPCTVEKMQNTIIGGLVSLSDHIDLIVSTTKN